MASGAFVDPLAVLRLTPLVSATCTLWFASDQHFFLRLFNKSETREANKALIPTYFRSMFGIGTAYVVGVLSVTMGTSIANIYTQPTVLGRALPWYKAGAWLAFGHLLFVPLIAPSVQNIFEKKGDVSDILDRWLRINLVRSLTMDLAAWGSIFVAVAKAFSTS